MPRPDRLRLFLWITLSSTLLGAIFGHAVGKGAGNSGAGPYLRGAVDAMLIAAALSSFEIFVLSGILAAVLRRTPFLPHLGLRSLAYLGIITLALAAGYWLAPLTGESSIVPSRSDVVFSLAVSVGYNLFFGVNRLLGPGVLLAFVAGRYHRPRIEERVLLSIDMRSSTVISERPGEVRFLDFLNRFVADLSLAIAEAGGEIHKYVGDEIIATWTLAGGLREARWGRCRCTARRSRSSSTRSRRREHRQRCRSISLRQLTPAATMAKPAAVNSVTALARTPNSPNISATSAAPTVWPRSRAVPSMPLAPPLRSRGAEPRMARLLGDWNRPKPAPHSVMRQAMSPTAGCAGSSASAASPAAKAARPRPPRRPAG